MKGKFIIKPVYRGFKKGQFRFILKGINNEIIGLGETYTQKHNAIDVYNEYFSNFELVDQTSREFLGGKRKNKK